MYLFITLFDFFFLKCKWWPW